MYRAYRGVCAVGHPLRVARSLYRISVEVKRQTQLDAPPAQNEAIRLAQLAASEGEEYDPGDDFIPASAYAEFVFSAPDLLRVLDRRNRVDRSWNLNERPPTFPKAA